VSVTGLAERSAELAEVVDGCDWFVGMLATVRSVGLADAWVGAGVLRDLVWGRRFGSGFRPGEVRDVDVAFFDPADLSRESDRTATDLLLARRPDVPWEATNQAAVHIWYHELFSGDRLPPLISTADVVGTWPETATSVAVRLASGEDQSRPGAAAVLPSSGARLEICAPLELDDLLDGVWRRNPRRITVELSRARLLRHDPVRRWPGVRVVEP
jgi:hypothetical protein